MIGILPYASESFTFALLQELTGAEITEQAALAAPLPLAIPLSTAYGDCLADCASLPKVIGHLFGAEDALKLAD